MNCPNCNSTLDSVTVHCGCGEQLKAIPRDHGWKPIRTAPKDGSEVILFVKIRAGIPKRMLVGHYQEGGLCIEDHPPIDQGWYFWNGCMFDIASEPTHWMTLPDEPKQ